MPHKYFMEWPFQTHHLYNRLRDIHEPYGGQRQGGIATPRDYPVLFLFTGDGAARVGYGDQWQDDGSLRYTGEGQVGDMQMVRGNLALRDHAANGKDLLLFERAKRQKTTQYEYLGRYVCAGWETELQNDSAGNSRQAIVFILVPAEGLEAVDDAALSEEDATETPFGELRMKALAAAAPSQRIGDARGAIYRRSKAVRDYVIARAQGRCEGCGAEAPFVTIKGRPYLEPHHILRLTDGGPDDPRQVAALCPNCHRKAHFGCDGPSFNADLRRAILQKEHMHEG